MPTSPSTVWVPSATRTTRMHLGFGVRASPPLNMRRPPLSWYLLLPRLLTGCFSTVKRFDLLARLLAFDLLLLGSKAKPRAAFWMG